MTRRREVLAAGFIGAGLGAVVTWSLEWWIVAGWIVVGAVAGSAAAIDASTGRIPNQLSLIALLAVAAAACVGSFQTGPTVLGHVALGAVVGGGLFVLLWLAHQMGGGDVKLAGVLGAAAGLISLSCAVVAAVGMCSLSSVAGLAVVMRRGRTSTVRLGPALLTGALAGVFVCRRGWLHA